MQKENRGIATSHKWISEAHTAHYLKPQRRSTSNELKLGQCCVCRFTFFHLLSRSFARQTHFVACSASDFRSINFYFFLNKNNRKFHSSESKKKKKKLKVKIQLISNEFLAEFFFHGLLFFFSFLRLHAVRIVFNSLFKMKSKSRTFFYFLFGVMRMLNEED